MKKIKTKSSKLISFLAIIFCAFLLTGCASVDYSRFVYPTGEITDKIVIELDKKKIIAAGYSQSDIASVCASIKNDLENYYVLPVRQFVSNIVADETISFDTKKYVSEGLISNAEIVNNSQVFAEINYATVELFNLYYGITENDEDDSNIEFVEGSFVNKYVQSSQNAYAVLKTETLKQIMKKYERFFAGKFDINNVKLTQVYASANTDIKSNANAVETSQGIKMHQWEISPQNLDFEIEFYTVSPNTASWYILGFAAALFVTFVLYCYARSKNHKENSKLSNKK